MPEQVLDLLRQGAVTISTAESLTGGRVAAQLTAVPGASESFRGGVVAYASELKVSVLGVSQSLVDRHGVVSAECALAMAQGVRALTGSTYGVATTGVAGPSRQEGKPVGTVYVGLSGPSIEVTQELHLTGDRAEIVQQSVEAALTAVAEQLTTTLDA